MKHARCTGKATLCSRHQAQHPARGSNSLADNRACSECVLWCCGAAAGTSAPSVTSTGMVTWSRPSRHTRCCWAPPSHPHQGLGCEAHTECKPAAVHSRITIAVSSAGIGCWRRLVCCHAVHCTSAAGCAVFASAAAMWTQRGLQALTGLQHGQGSRGLGF